MSQAEHDKRVDYVEFPCSDMQATKRFYQQVFGWKFTDWGEEYISFEDGRLTGGFHTGTPTPGGGALVVIYANDLEAVEAEVKAAGGKVVQEIFSFPGGRRFHFSDPGGNELAVWSDK